jgi:hypothetical protein
MPILQLPDLKQRAKLRGITMQIYDRRIEYSR